MPGARTRRRAPTSPMATSARRRVAEHYGALGADGDCGGVLRLGVTACADLLARRGGLPDTRLYVGSWSRWGADDTPRPAPTPHSRRSTLG